MPVTLGDTSTVTNLPEVSPLARVYVCTRSNSKKALFLIFIWHHMSPLFLTLLVTLHLSSFRYTHTEGGIFGDTSSNLVTLTENAPARKRLGRARDSSGSIPCRTTFPTTSAHGESAKRGTTPMNMHFFLCGNIPCKTGTLHESRRNEVNES